MGWLSAIGLGFKFLIKLLDFLASREKTLQDKIANKRDDLQGKKDAFASNLRKGEYEKASHSLRNVVNDINILRQQSKRPPEPSDQ